MDPFEECELYFYEGDNKSMILPIRVLKNFGIKTLIITNYGKPNGYN